MSQPEAPAGGPRGGPRPKAGDSHPWGERIREHRERRGLSLKALADKSKLSESALIRIEAGKGANTATLDLIAEALGVSVAELSVSPESSDAGNFFAHLDAVVGGSPQELVDVLRGLSHVQALAYALNRFHELSHKAIEEAIPGPDVGRVPPDKLKEFESALSGPLRGMTDEPIAKTRLLNAFGRFCMFAGTLVAVGKVDADNPFAEREKRFLQAESLFKESIKLGEQLEASELPFLDAKLQLDELALERRFWKLREEQLKPLPREVVDGFCTELNRIRSSAKSTYGRYSQLSGSGDGLACRFLLLRIDYLHARALLAVGNGSLDEKRTARKLFLQSSEEAQSLRSRHRALKWFDQAFWAEAVAAKCSLRLALCDEDASHREMAIEAYVDAISVNRNELYDLRSLCFLESLYRDVEHLSRSRNSFAVKLALETYGRLPFPIPSISAA